VRASGGSIHAVAEDEIAANMALLAERSGVFGEAAAGICVGALRRAIDAGIVRPDDSVVLLVTGDGLKTPGLIADRLRAVEVDADADALLQQLGVAA
jgi:threonine synthase